MQFILTHRNCLPGEDKSPMEKRFGLRPVSTPGRLNTLDLESGMAHMQICASSSGQYSARGQVALCIQDIQTTTRSCQAKPCPGDIIITA